MRGFWAALALAAPASAGLIAAAAPAAAHVVLDRSEAPANSYVRLLFRVGHGCQGAATESIRVTLPPELLGASPAPKPGWALSITPAAPDSAAPRQGGHGGPPPREITWRGGSLPSEQFDEFAVLVHTPATPGATLFFPVEQGCAEGRSSSWSQRPSQPGEKLPMPAPALRLVAKP